jgi:hypothetical protein
MTSASAFAWNNWDWNWPSRDSQSSAPEIDPTQSLAVLAVLVCVGLIARERLIRRSRTA